MSKAAFNRLDVNFEIFLRNIFILADFGMKLETMPSADIVWFNDVSYVAGLNFGGHSKENNGR